jgi:ADP-ribose pyrophosphatase YjhB (NUDIX family)
MSKGHAVAVLLVTPEGIPLVRDSKKPSPVFWKLPGGRGGATETAEEVALREVAEEIGVYLEEDSLEVIHQEDKGSHILTIFQATTSQLTGLRQQGDEGEEIGIFSPREILSMEDFFPNHLRVIRKRLVEATGS